MTDLLINSLKSIPANLVFDLGLIGLVALSFLALLLIHSKLALDYSGPLGKVMRRLPADEAGPVPYKKLLKLIGGLPPRLADLWQANIYQPTAGQEDQAWIKADHQDMAKQAVYDYSWRGLARLVPGLAGAIALFASGLASFIALSLAPADQLATVRQLCWQKTLILLLTALLVSLLFLLLDGLFLALAQAKTRTFIDKSSRLLDQVPADEGQRLVLQELEATRAGIASLEEGIVTSLLELGQEHLLPALTASYKDSLDHYLLPQVERLAQATDRLGQELVQVQTSGMADLARGFQEALTGKIDQQIDHQLDQLARLDKMLLDQTDKVQALLADTDQTISLQHSLNDQALATIKEMGQVKVQMTDSAQQLAEGMEKTADLAQIMQELLAADRQLIEQLVSEREAIQKINDGYFEQMNQQVYQMQTDLNTSITDILSKFTEIYTVTFESIEEQTTGLIDNFDHQTASLIESLDDQVRDLTFLTKDVATELADLNSNLKESSQEFAGAVNLSLSDHLQQLDHNVSELVTRLAQTTEMIRASVDDLPAAVLLARMSLTPEISGDQDQQLAGSSPGKE